MTINGEFYIDNNNDFFYLREAGAWNYKGVLMRVLGVGLVSAGPYPFTDSQIFEIAPGPSAIEFTAAYSTARSKVECEYPTAGACSVVFTDNLPGFLSTGTNIICQADFAAVSQRATLTFNDTIVPAFAPLWVVMPATADVAMAGLRASFSGEPV